MRRILLIPAVLALVLLFGLTPAVSREEIRSIPQVVETLESRLDNLELKIEDLESLLNSHPQKVKAPGELHDIDPQGGFTTLPGGIVLQWGTFTLGKDLQDQEVLYGEAFDEEALAVIVSLPGRVTLVDKVTFRFDMQDVYKDIDDKPFYIAIGH